MIHKDFAVVACFLLHLFASNYIFVGFNNLILGWWYGTSGMRIEFNREELDLRAMCKRMWLL